jgi:hypothetical protein
MHILGSPDFSALEPEMPAVFGHLPHHFYVGLMGEHIDEKSGLGDGCGLLGATPA